MLTEAATGADAKAAVSRLTRRSSTLRRALDELVAQSDSAARALLGMVDEAATQRAMVRAWENGEISTVELGKSLRRYESLDAEEQALFRESITRSRADGVRLLNTDVCNSPCDDAITAANELAEGYDLTAEEKRHLISTLEEGETVSTAPGDDTAQVLKNLRALDQSEKVDGLGDALKSLNGDSKGYKGIAGEAKIATTKVDAGHEATIQEDVSSGDLSSKRLRSSDVDRSLGGEDLLGVNKGKSDIDVEADGVAYESKNVRFQPYTEAQPAYRAFGEQLNDLRRKLNTWAATGEDEIVVVVRKGELDKKYGTEITNEFPDPVADVDRLEKVGQEVEDDFDGVDVTFKTYDDVN